MRIINTVKMARGQVEMKRIENAARRQVTFSKRRKGLVKKASELSVLCDAQLALIIFSPQGKLFEFSSSTSNVGQIIDRYRESTKEARTRHENAPPPPQYIQSIKHETIMMEMEIETVEAAQRKLLGQGLGSCSLQELDEIDRQLVMSLNNIRSRKDEVCRAQIKTLKGKGKHLLEENTRLREKCGMRRNEILSTKQKEKENETNKKQRRCMDMVETDLFIGLIPPSRCS